MEREPELPSWLTDALASEVAPPRGTLSKQQPAKIGDIYLVTPGRLGMGANRLCAVLELDSAMETARVVLLTNETEYACDWDVRMSRDEFRLPYELMVECDIVSSVWLSQLGEHVGRVPGALRPGIVATTTGTISAIDETRRATPIHGPDDPRWVFREHELRALHALSDECMSRLIDGLIVDPRLVASIAEVDQVRQSEIATALCDHAELETLTIHTASLELLCASNLTIDPDVWNALQPLLDAASGSGFLTHSRSAQEVSSVLAEWVEIHRPPVVREAFDSLLNSLLQEGVPIAHVLTRRDVWGGSDILYGQSNQGTRCALVPAIMLE